MRRRSKAAGGRRCYLLSPENSYDLEALNPNAKKDEDLRTPHDLLDLIVIKGREVADGVTALRRVAGRQEQ